MAISGSPQKDDGRSAGPGDLRRRREDGEALHRVLRGERAEPEHQGGVLGAARRFAGWCADADVELQDVEPVVVAAYIEQLQEGYAPATVKQHLAAIRMLFDWLVVSHILRANPASAVRGPRHVVKVGKVPVLSAEEARGLLDSVDVSEIVGLRDRALISVLFGMARVSAAVSMRVEDYYTQGTRGYLRLREKGGKYMPVPAHHQVQEYVDGYIEAAGFGEDRDGALFRAAQGPGRAPATLTGNRMDRGSAWSMVKRRARNPGLLREITPHSFRATGITEYIRNGGRRRRRRGSPGTSLRGRRSFTTASRRTSGLGERRVVDLGGDCWVGLCMAVSCTESE